MTPRGQSQVSARGRSVTYANSIDAKQSHQVMWFSGLGTWKKKKISHFTRNKSGGMLSTYGALKT